MVGRRTNVNTTKLYDGVELSSERLAEIAQNETLFITDAQDYFITTWGGFPWGSIPNFVVGRIGYDNWLLVTAITKEIPLVDLTETLLAVHQSDATGNFAGHHKKTKEDCHTNLNLVAKPFDYFLGHTTCSQFQSQMRDGLVTLVARTKNICWRL
jgi:hypothetical protein